MLKVTVPIGLNPPDSVAVSVTVPPRGTVPEGWVAMAGLAWLTTTLSPGSLQAVDVGLLLPSPRYRATQR
jgi:hypothetical protein